jgi:RHS repeat-associated protein
MAWAPADYYLTYTAYDASTGKVVRQDRAANLTTTVSRLSSVTLDATIKAMPVGKYIVDFSMMHKGGPSFITENVPPARMIIQVYNLPPVLKEVYPPNGSLAGTLTPQLWGEATDLDAPKSGLTYNFQVCPKNDDGTLGTCFSSGYSATFAWTVPAGKLVWNKTYTWKAQVKDSNGAVVTGPEVTLLTDVPQPQLASPAASADGRPYDLVTGAYTTSAVDAPVTTVGPELTIQRTYNSLDARTTTAFGSGWSSRYDMRVTPEPAGSVLVTIQDGSQVRFGRNADGTYAPPRGRTLALTQDATSYVLKDATGTAYTFSTAGLLVSIKPALGAATTLTYSSGKLTRITNGISRRSLSFTWTAGHVTRVSTDPVDGTALSWAYTYSGNSLTSACGPDGKCATYAATPVSLYRAAVSLSNPDSYWRLGEASGETSATSEVAVNLGKDAATYAGAGLGGTGALAGTTNKAATFNGSSSSVTLPKGIVKRNRELGVEMWFKIGTKGVAAPLLGYQNTALTGTASSGAPVLYVGTDGKLRGQFANGTINPITSTALVDNQLWHHVVLQSVGTTQTMYLDGVKVGTLTGPPTHTLLAHNQLGAANVTGTWAGYGTGRKYLNGAIDEVALYSKPLSDAEIASHYSVGQTAANAISQVDLASGRTNASISYDTATARVTEYVDQNGGAWKLTAPSTSGTDTDLRRTVMLKDPADRASFFEYDALTGRLLRSGSPSGISVRPEDTPTPTTTTTTPTQPSCPVPDPEDPQFCIIVIGGDPVFVVQPIEGVAVKSYEYDDKGRLTKSVDENGNWVDLTYDSRGNVTSQTSCRERSAPNTDCSTRYTKYGTGFTDPLDPRWDRPIEQRDGRSSSATDTRYLTKLTYTATGLPESQTAPDGGRSTTTYTTGQQMAVGGGYMPAGLPLTVTDPRGAVTTMGYFSTGDLAKVTEPSGLTTTFTYDALGRKTSQTEVSDTYPAGTTTTYTYDAYSRLVSETEPTTTDAVTGVKHQRRTTTAYDDDGNVTATTIADVLGNDRPRTTSFEYDDRGRLARVVAPNGAETTYGYDRFGNKTWMVDANDNRFEYAYTTRNMLAEERLRDFGNSSTGYTVLSAKAYDLAGHAVRTVDGMGRSVRTDYNDDDSVRSRVLEDYVRPDGTKGELVLAQYTYDGAGRVTKVVSAGGEDTTTTAYDAVGRVAQSTADPSGLARSAAYTYDLGGNVLKVVASGRPSNVPWGSTLTSQTTNYGYDAAGRRTSEVLVAKDGSERKSTYAYDRRGLLVSAVSPRGYETGADPADFTTEVSSDELGRTTRTVEPARQVESGGGAPTSVRPTTFAGFNTFDEVTSTKDAAGMVTTSTFDDAGQAIKVSQPAYTPPGGTSVTPSVTNEYDPLGNLVKRTDPLGLSTTFTYDRLNRLVRRVEPTGSGDTATWSYSYTLTGEVARVTDPNGAVTEATYDQLDRQVTSTVVERTPAVVNLVTKYAYTAGGRLASTSSPTGATSTYTYDSLGQVIETKDPHGVTLTMGYDYLGNQVRASDGAGRTQRSDYDTTGDLLSVSDVTATTTPIRTQSYSYDHEGNMLSSSNPGGRATTYTYDAGGNLVRQVEPVDDSKSITTSFGYDAEERNTRYTDGRGNSSVTTYNSQGALESVTEPSTAAYPDPADRTWTAAYDAAGRPVKLTSPGGVVRTRTYDDAGRLVNEAGSGGGAASASRAVTYDKVGRITGVSTPRGNDAFGYNDRGQLLSASGPSGDASFAYNEDGAMVSRDDAAGRSTFTYDRGRLDTVTDGVTASSQKLSYDPAGDLSGVDYGSGRTRAYGYDNLGRLQTDVLKNSSGSVVSSITYGYDLQDNLTSKDTTGFGAAEQNAYTYDQASRMTSWTSNGVSTLYEWDDSGNRTREGDRVATYDERNRLLTDGSTTFTYTARGTVKSRTKGGATTALTFDAFDRMVADGSVTYTYDGLDRVDAASGAIQSYAGVERDPVRAGAESYGRSVDGSLLSVATGAESRVVVADQHGDVVGGFKPADTTLSILADTRSYTPYGSPKGSTGMKYAVGFQGDWTDPSTGKVNMGARWYDPSTGAFASRDTVGYRGGDSILANKFTYAAGNPMTFTDPDGHWPSCGWCSKVANTVKSGWNTATRAVSTAYRATTSAISYGWNRMVDYGRAAYNWAKTTVVKAAKATWNAVKSAATWVWEKGKAAYNTVKSYVSAGYNAVKSAVSSGIQWAKQQAAAAARKIYEAKVRVTQVAKAAISYAAKHNPIPAIKAALKPVLNGIKVVTKAALALPAAVVAVTKDVVKAGAVAVQQIYEQAVSTVGTVVSAVSKAATAVSEFVQEHKAAIAGVLTGIAVTAGCLAITAGAGSGACVVAGMAAGNAVMSALSCPPGRSVVGCAARGAAVGAVAGVITVASGGSAAGLILGGAAASGASTALDGALSGEGVNAGDILKSAVIGAATGGVGAKLGPALSRIRGGCNSFTASTKVLLADGKLKAIKDVALGDRVRATDPMTGKSSARVVTNLIRHAGLHAMVLVAIVGGGTIDATDGHPFYDARSGEFVKASSLSAGDRLRLEDGRTVRVASTTAYVEDLTAYNFTVDVDHTYYVSDDAGSAVLVHNTGTCTITPGGSGASQAVDYSRPAGYRAGVRDKVWENARETSTGQVRDPLTGRFMSKDAPWDMGHLPGLEFRRLAAEAQAQGLTRKQFLDQHNDPTHYRPELPSSNRSHRGELLDD